MAIKQYLSANDAAEMLGVRLTIHHLSELIEETEAQVAHLSVTEPWNEPMTFLMQIPGIGLYTGMTILAASSDITRFPSARQLVGYAGLGARVHDSGDTHRSGKISKQGCSELRTAPIVCVWSAVCWSVYWRVQFQPLARRIGRHKAITANARKPLVTIWHVLTKRQTDRHVDPQVVARSLMTWASLHHLAQSLGVYRWRLSVNGLNRSEVGNTVDESERMGEAPFRFLLDTSNY